VVGNSRQLTLATLSFGLCFYAWALLGPLGPDLQDQLGPSEGKHALIVSIPVVLGSLMRIPLGVLADRHGGRRVFTLLAVVNGRSWVQVRLPASRLLPRRWVDYRSIGKHKPRKGTQSQ
jgi:MFS family permease